MTINKSAGRPSLPIEEKRSVVVQFRCTPTERKILEKTAKSKGMKLSDWLRKSVLKSAN